jgi:hypothetical protein
MYGCQPSLYPPYLNQLLRNKASFLIVFRRLAHQTQLRYHVPPSSKYVYCGTWIILSGFFFHIFASLYQFPSIITTSPLPLPAYIHTHLTHSLII